ncbi:MFS transporter, partial [Ruminococcus sp. B05]
MTIEDVIKKSILPLAFMVFWFWMTKTIMKVSGQTDWFWWVFIAGLPFGIHKMRLIL